MLTKQVQACKRILQTMLAKSIQIQPQDQPLHSNTTFSTKTVYKNVVKKRTKTYY